MTWSVIWKAELYHIQFNDQAVLPSPSNLHPWNSVTSMFNVFQPSNIPRSTYYGRRTVLLKPQSTLRPSRKPSPLSKLGSRGVPARRTPVGIATWAKRLASAGGSAVAYVSLPTSWPEIWVTYASRESKRSRAIYCMTKAAEMASRGPRLKRGDPWSRGS